MTNEMARAANFAADWCDFYRGGFNYFGPAADQLSQHDSHIHRYRFHLAHHEAIQARLRRELPVIHAAQAKRARRNEKRLKGRGL